MIVEGEVAVRRFLEHASRSTRVLTTAGHLARLRDVLGETEVLVAGKALLREVVGFDFHRGCLATGPRPDVGDDTWPARLEHLQRGAPRTIIAAEGLSDPVNVGAIVRNARALGADLVVLDAAGADPFSRRAIRASMGNVFGQPILVTNALASRVVELRDALGSTVIAATVSLRAVDLRRLPWPAVAIIMVGNEGRGLSTSLLALAAHEVTIPVHPGADSLNVAAATAILLYARDREQNL